VPKPAAPQDDLPWNIRELTTTGQRAAWSPDGKKIAYLDREFGDAWEYDLATGTTRNLTGGFAHAGFLRVQYLPDADYLLTGPKTFVDPTTSRFDDAEFWVMKKSDLSRVYPLNQKVFEGVAISSKTNTIAWVNDKRQYASLSNVGAVLYTADIVYVNGVPTLANKREVYRASFGMEAQDFRSNDREIICPKYYTNGADVIGINIDTKAVTTYRTVAGEYNEPEGIFPDGKSILVESSRDRSAVPSLSQNLDIWKLDLEPGSTKFARVTRWGDFGGYKATNPVVSPDGRFIAFQSALVGQTAGNGNGLFLLDTMTAPATSPTTLFSDSFSGNPALSWQIKAVSTDASIASSQSNGSQVVLSKNADGTAATISLTKTIDTRGFDDISIRLDAFQSATHFEGADSLKIEFDAGYGFTHLLTDAERFDAVDNATADNIAASNAALTPTSTGYLALPRSAANTQSLRIRITGTFDEAAEKYLLDYFQVVGRRD
jgi:Tol biopolymer transport system component